MELLTVALYYTGTMVLGFLATQIYGWYQEETRQEDALLINVATQTSPVKKIRLQNYVPNKMDIDDDDIQSTGSDSDSLSSFLITN